MAFDREKWLEEQAEKREASEREERRHLESLAATIMAGLIVATATEDSTQSVRYVAGDALRHARELIEQNRRPKRVPEGDDEEIQDGA